MSTIHRQPLDMSVNVMMLAQGTTGTVPHNGTYPCTSEGLVDGLAMPEGDVRVGLETYIVYLDIYGLVGNGTPKQAEPWRRGPHVK